MLTLQDCLDMCDMSPDVIDAVAERERLPDILAAELASRLGASPDGRAALRRTLLDSAANAVQKGDYDRAERLARTLVAFKDDPA